MTGGIADTLLDMVQKRGVRIDQTIAGTGRGQVILNDILGIYDGNLELSVSPLGTLKARFPLPLPLLLGESAERFFIFFARQIPTGWNGRICRALAT